MKIFTTTTAAHGAALGALLFAASPALADHAGPSGLGAGGGQWVIGPETLPAGKAYVGFRLTYTRPDRRSDAELIALAGEHIHAHNSDYNLNASAGLAYGLTDRLTLSAELPHMRRDDLREGTHDHVGGGPVNGVEQLGSVSGIGDLNLLAKLKLAGGERIGAALLAGLKVPTGGTHKHSIEEQRLETEHQPGTGSWDPLIGAAFATAHGPIRLSVSALYQVAGKGAQHTRLGDRLQAGIAISHRFGLAEHHHHDDELEHGEERPHGHAAWDGMIELIGEIEGRQKVDGEIEEASGGRSLWLSPGVRYSSKSGTSFGLSFGVPVAQHIRASHPDNHYRLSLAIGRSF